MARRKKNRRNGPRRNPSPEEESSIVPVVGLSELFALPLTALVEADVYGSKAFLEFIQTFAFEPVPGGGDDNYGRLRTVTFYYTATDPSGLAQQMRVEIPWISLVPLPLLSIKDAHMEFEVEVVGVVETDTSPVTARKSNDRKNAKKADAPKRRQLQGRLLRSSQSAIPVSKKTIKPSRTPNQSVRRTADGSETTVSEQVRSRVNMHVQLNMGQSDLPMGVIQLLNLSQQGTLEQSLKAPFMTLESRNNQLVFDTIGQKLELDVGLFNELGLPIAGVDVDLSQDDDPAFSPVSEIVRTDDAGKALARFILKQLPERDVELKTIYAKAVVETEKYQQADVSASINTEIRRKPDP